MLSVNNLRVSLKGKTILENICLNFTMPSLIAVTGPNGCGKTTLLKAIGGQCSYQGKISINNKTIHKQTLRKNASISLTYQTYINNYKDEKVLNLLNKLNSLPRFDKEKCLESLKEIKLDYILHSKIQTLSEGEKNRLITCLTLSYDALIYLLDEPLTSLDNETAKEVKALLIKYSKEYLIIYSTHDNLSKEQDEVVVNLKDNKNIIIDKGTTKSIILNKETSFKKSISFLYNIKIGYLALMHIVFALVCGVISGININPIANYINVPKIISSSIKDNIVHDKDLDNTRSTVESATTREIDIYSYYEIEEFTYNENNIKSSDFFESYLNIPAVSSKIYDIEVPKGQFYMTKPLSDYFINNIDKLVSYGVTSKPYELIKLGPLTYGGIIENDNYCFIVNPNDAYVLNGSNSESIRYYNQYFYQGNLLDRDGNIIDYELKENEIAIGYTPENIPFATIAYYGTIYYVVAFFETPTLKSNAVIFSDSVDTFEYNIQFGLGYNRTVFSNRIAYDKESIIRAIPSLENEFVSYLDENISDYKAYIQDDFIIGIVFISTSFALWLLYALFFVIFIYNRNKYNINYISNIGEKVKTIQAIAPTASTLISILSIFIIIAMFAPAAFSNSITYLVLLLPIIILLISFITVCCVNPSYPLLENTEDEK